MEAFDFGNRRATEFRHRSFRAVCKERYPEERPRRAGHWPWFRHRAMPGIEPVPAISDWIVTEASLFECPAAVRVGQPA